MGTNRDRQEKKAKYISAKERVKEQDSGWKPTAFKVPEGMSVFKFKKIGVYKIDIIPYVAGKGNPYADPGVMTYERAYYTHNEIGPNRETHCCLRKTFNKSCPICEHKFRLSSEPDQDEALIKSLKEKVRQLYLIYDHAEPEKGLQLMETGYYKTWGEMLANKIEASDEEDDYDTFFHVPGGKTLKVTVDEDSFATNTGGSRKFFKATNIEMKPRSEELEEKLAELVEEAPCLDELPIADDAEALRKLFLQIEDAEPAKKPASDKKKPAPADDDDDAADDDDGKPKKPAAAATGKKKPVPADDDDADDAAGDDDDAGDASDEPTASDLGIVKGDVVVHKKYGICDVIHVSGDGTSLRLEDSKGEDHRGVAPAECKKKDKKKPVPTDDDGDDEKPQKPAAGKKKPVPEDDDADADDDDGKPKKPAAGKKKPVDKDDAEAFDDDWGDEKPKKPAAGKKKPVPEDDDADDGDGEDND